MKLKYYLIFILPLAIVACGQETDKVAVKQKELSKAKEELFSLKEKINELEKELADLGVDESNLTRPLVTTVAVKPTFFEHKVDVRGTVQSRNNILLSAETPAAVKVVHVVEGQQVKKGQILITQDSEILKRNIEELRSSLELAATVYERQKKLWEQNIGTEVQYLEAKNRKESLELKLATTQSQLNKTKIKAPFNGIVDMIDIRVGEMAQPGFPIIRLVSMSNMYIKADVSESFVGKFKQGQTVDVYFPSTDIRIKSSVKSIGLVINPNNRTFEVEVGIPANMTVKPNMIAVLTLTDYKNEQAMVVPTKIIQSDRRGKFVYKVAAVDGDIKQAERVEIELGITNGKETEITSGLKEGDELVLKGGLGLTDGAEVKVVEE